MRTPGWGVARDDSVHRSPLKRASILILARACCCFFGLTTITHGAWVPITEDSVDLKLTVSSLALDTTHFPNPTLIVGTYRDSSGLSLVMTVDPLTLEPIDTVYRSTYVPNVCRAVDLNADTHLDFLVGLTSLYAEANKYSAVVALYGPDYLTEDTLRLPRTASDLLVDETQQEIWLGYTLDSSTVTPGQFQTWYWHGLVGFLGAFTYDLVQSRFAGDSLAGQVFTLCDVNADGAPDLVALWLMAESAWCSGCIAAPKPNWIATGVWNLDGATEAASFQKWIELGSRGSEEGSNAIYAYQKLPVLDLTGDGTAETVFSWTWYGGPPGGPTGSRAYVEVHSLADGRRLWQRQLPLPNGGSSRYAAIPYSLDSLDAPVLLLIGMNFAFPSKYAMIGLRGDNGDSLFATEFRYVSSLNASLVSPAWNRARIIDASGTWLFRWWLDEATSVVELIPDHFVLHPTFPNPFNAHTRVSYRLKASTKVTLTVHDLLGRHVTTLVDARQAAGDYSLNWDGRNSDRLKAPSGVYFLRLSAGDESFTRKMALIK